MKSGWLSQLSACALAVPLLLAWGVAAAEWAGEPQTPLKIELEGLADVTGMVYIALYNREEDWLGENVFAAAELEIESSREGELVSTELLLPPGQYAMTVFHDSNGNGELDTSFMGSPKEPIAMSNNAKSKFGPPDYEDAVFDVVLEPVIQRVNIRPF